MVHDYLLEKPLIDKIKMGDESAFEITYKTYWSILYNYGYRRLKRKEVVEGLVQEVFVALWKDRKRLEIDHSLIGYLKTCMKFKVMNQLKSQLVKEKYKIFATRSTSRTCSVVEEKILYDELQLAYAREIELLPIQAKKAYRLRMESGMSCVEIAGELKLSPSTVEKHLAKANRILRENLRPFYFLSALIVELAT